MSSTSSLLQLARSPPTLTKLEFSKTSEQFSLSPKVKVKLEAGVLGRTEHVNDCSEPERALDGSLPVLYCFEYFLKVVGS